MRNDQMAGSQAGNTWKGFQNSKFNIDTTGRELLPTMTHSYNMSGHVTRRCALKQTNWPNLKGHFISVYISKSSTDSSLKYYTANCATNNGMIWEFGVNQKISYWVMTNFFVWKFCGLTLKGLDSWPTSLKFRPE